LIWPAAAARELVRTRIVSRIPPRRGAGLRDRPIAAAQRSCAPEGPLSALPGFQTVWQLAAPISALGVLGRIFKGCTALVRRPEFWSGIGRAARLYRHKGAPPACFASIWKRCSEREPLIGIGISDSSRAPHVVPEEVSGAKPGRDSRGFVRAEAIGVLDQDEENVKMCVNGYEKTLRDTPVWGAKLSLALGWTANSGGRKP
jgi:hypothetical protein